MSDPLLSPLPALRGIGKSFLGVRVLDGVDVDVRPGEVHAVVGENGAGKSTLVAIATAASIWRPSLRRRTHLPATGCPTSEPLSGELTALP
jgi:ABC-type phosphonate transport system ATPase subunit